MAEMLSIRQAVERCRRDGLPISDYALRIWIKRGDIPARFVGTKALVFYPALVEYLTGANQVEVKGL